MPKDKVESHPEATLKGHWFVKRVADAIARRSLLAPEQGVLVAVSGGPDSVALLHALAALAPGQRWDLWVAHLDHGLRGREGEGDAAYVRELAVSLGLEFIGGRADVAALARQRGLSLESAGRRARYSFFLEQATHRGLHRVAVGHTQDDQAETVLLRLLRGAGVEGLAAIPWARTLGGTVAVVRPMLAITREEILDYCSDLGVEPRMDLSNASLEFWRNRVRHLLLPLLEREFAPNIREILARTAAICQDEAELLARDTLAASAATVLEVREGCAVLHREALLGHPRARARRIVRRATAEAGLRPGLEYVHVEAVLDLAAQATGAGVNLPDGFTAVVEDVSRLVVARAPAAPGLPWSGARVLAVPGSTPVPELGVLFRTGWLDGVKARQVAGPELAPHRAVLDGESLDFPLLVRCRREGDRFRPLGMSGTRKLKDFLMSAGVPRAERDRVPLVVAAGQIVWVAGHRPDDRFRVTAATRTGLSLECLPLDPGAS